MANKSTPPAAKAPVFTAPKPVKNDEVPDAPATVTDTPAAVDWDALPEATLVSYKRVAGLAPKDYEAITPAPIKSRVMDAFQATVKSADPKVPVRFNQQCGSEAAAADFLKLARNYASFKDLTLRGGISGSVVTYSVRVKEERKRLTPEEKAAAAAAAAKKAVEKAAAKQAKLDSDAADAAVAAVKKSVKP
jgi:hypothetical protein